MYLVWWLGLVLALFVVLFIMEHLFVFATEFFHDWDKLHRIFVHKIALAAYLRIVTISIYQWLAVCDNTVMVHQSTVNTLTYARVLSLLSSQLNTWRLQGTFLLGALWTHPLQVKSSSRHMHIQSYRGMHFCNVWPWDIAATSLANYLDLQ